MMSSLVLFGAVDNWVSMWLTPVWLLGVGAIFGLALLLLLWCFALVVARLPVIGRSANAIQDARAEDSGALFTQWILRPLLVPFSHRTVTEIPAAVREGALWPIFLTTVSLAAFGIFGAIFVEEPLQLLSSLTRLPSVGTATLEFEIPVSEPEDPNDSFSDLKASQIPVSLKVAEVRSLTFASDQRLSVATRPFLDVKPGASLEVNAGEPAVWHKGVQTVSPLVDADVTEFHIRNLGSDVAKLTLTTVTAPPDPEVALIPIVALMIAVVFLLYIWQRAVAPRMSAIALAAYKSEVAQPLFGILLLLGLFALWMFIWIPYNTFGEDIKMLKDAGLVLIRILGIILAVWAASNSVADEIEGKTALTVLSKPIGRRSFVLGKFLGIVWTLAVLFVFLGLMLLIVVAYKPIHESREAATQDLTWQLCHLEMVYTMPGLALMFMETVVMGAISVAISTRLPLLANFILCLGIYLLGHLTPLIVKSSIGQFVPVQFFGQFVATVFPNLDHFDIQAAVAAGLPVPFVYLFVALVYCVIYTLIAMLLALVLFEDRDLA
ncbi:MAG: ABC transporter permease [Pirellulaceae bacterium]|nr:ABC transporter permease [Pirellulaceae bacterium]